MKFCSWLSKAIANERRHCIYMQRVLSLVKTFPSHIEIQIGSSLQWPRKRPPHDVFVVVSCVYIGHLRVEAPFTNID